ncbi:hypothetical protein [Nitrosopumilus sp.]|uniref:hypothetical protein n=1 Tax=Nitrosopumilus sp. TaxID=2024843 RepID=UPI00247B818D|nr:hypothetical protein [Nitrosopumilus sp.]MCV0409615.1 hypothetical protein [Nitrosopumilus sp.]
MKTRLLIIIGIIVLVSVSFFSYLQWGTGTPSQLHCMFNKCGIELGGRVVYPTLDPTMSRNSVGISSEPRITGKMAQEICSITGGECPPNYPANIQEDGSKMTIVTTWDADTNTEKSFVFIIKNNTLSYDVHVIDKDVHPHPFDTTTEKKQHTVDPIYIENPHNSGELVLDLDSMQQVQKILDWCHRESLGFGVLDIGLSFKNETHYIDNNDCKWKKIDNEN